MTQFHPARAGETASPPVLKRDGARATIRLNRPRHLNRLQPEDLDVLLKRNLGQWCLVLDPGVPLHNQRRDVELVQIGMQSGHLVIWWSPPKASTRSAPGRSHR